MPEFIVDEDDKVYINVFSHHAYITSHNEGIVHLFSVEDHTGEADIDLPEDVFQKVFTEVKEV
jgi:hypothetical protein